MRIAFSAHAMCGCVKTLPIRYDFQYFNKYQPDFLDKRERKSETDKSKVKPYNLLGPSHPHLIHSP
jgi:hypothetical protein